MSDKFTVTGPKRRHPENSQTLTAYVGNELVNKVRETAKSKNVTMSQFVREALEFAISHID